MSDGVRPDHEYLNIEDRQYFNTGTRSVKTEPWQGPAQARRSSGGHKGGHGVQFVVFVFDG